MKFAKHFMKTGNRCLKRLVINFKGRQIAMEYKLVNPSDSYTFLADDLETAALTVFCLSPLYGAETKDDKMKVPIFIVGDSEEWYIEQFGRNSYDGIKDKRKQVVSALDSMMLGDFKDRRRYEAALSAITDLEKKKEFIVKCQNRHSSMNDIGTYCKKLAKKIEENISNDS